MTEAKVKPDGPASVEVRRSASAYALLVDEHPIVRLGFMTLLCQIDPQLKFIEADTSQLAIDLTLMHAPSFAMIDFSLAGGSSFDLIKKLRLASSSMPILVVSHLDERMYGERAVRAGARGYAMKTMSTKLIAKAVQTVREGKVWLSESLRDELVNRIAAVDGTSVGDQFRSLSDRELSVFRLIGRGLRKSGIAHELGLSPHTVESYRTNIKQKMGIASGAELYRLAFLHSQNSAVARPDEP